MPLRSLYQNRDYTIPVRITQTINGVVSAYNLTGHGIYFSVRRFLSDADPKIYKRNSVAGGSDAEIKILSAAQGTLEIYILRSDVLTAFNNGYYDLALYTPAGKLIEAVLPTLISVLPVAGIISI